MGTGHLKAAALEWATKRGVPVFPLNADNSPATRNGFHDASTDPAVIERMTFEHGIGGVPGAAGYVVLDVDTKHGATLADVPPEIAETLRYKTRSGGFHLWCLAEPGKDYGNGARLDLGDALDIRFDRGYVALAPTPGYRLDNAERFDAELCVAAPSVLESTSGPVQDRTAAPGGSGPPIPKGSQEGTLFTVARAAYDAGLDELAVRAAIRSTIETRCVDQDRGRPWAEHDVERIARPTLDSFSAAVRSGRLNMRDDQAGANAEPELEIKSLVGVQRKVAEQYPGTLNIPVGTISILTGQQGTGKGLLEVAEIAKVSQDHGVLIASDEDSIEHTILPRLVAAGAKIENLGMVQSLKLPDDTDGLVRRCLERDVRLVVVDPWTNHVGDIDVNKGPELRDALMALKVACDRAGFVALLTAHPNKNSMNPDPLERVAHSQALTQVARSAFYIVKDPEYRPGEHGMFDTDDYPNRLVAQVKANLTPFAATRVYRLRTRGLVAPVQSIAYLDYFCESDHDWLTLHKLAAERDRAPVSSAKGSAEQWLLELLADGPLVSSAVKAAADDDGHSWATVKRARVELVKAGRLADTKHGKPWSLPLGDESEAL